MLQSLLVERFRLKLHRETRSVSGLVLVVAKNGPKLKPANQEAKASISWIGRKMSSASISMEALANSLARQLKQVVVDGTSLKGSFEINFEYGPDDTGPSIFSAIQTLGLRLQSAKVPVDVAVIDHIEKVPTEN